MGESKSREMRSIDFSVPERLSAPLSQHFSTKARQRRLQNFVRAAEPIPEKLRPVITSKRQPRQSTPPPEYKPVEHSAAFVLRSKRPAEQEEDVFLEAEEKSNEPFTGNALQWYLRKVDRSLDEGDAQPSAAAKAYYDASQTPAGNQAVKGIGSVAGTAAKVGASAVKAAVPLGKWALMKGLGAAA